MVAGSNFVSQEGHAPAVVDLALLEVGGQVGRLADVLSHWPPRESGGRYALACGVFIGSILI